MSQQRRGWRIDVGPPRRDARQRGAILLAAALLVSAPLMARAGRVGPSVPQSAQKTVTAEVGTSAPPAALASGVSLDRANHLFYEGRYELAADMALALRRADVDALATFELRTSALHFQIRQAMGDGPDRKRALAACAGCAALLATFARDVTDGRARAQAALDRDPGDVDALFLLGKIDLNDVWMQLATLGRRTGWHEYWEARHSMDAVLVARPDYVRAVVARAWIDYIVDTKVTLGFRWVLGGGDRRKALATMRRVAATGEGFAHTEAAFGLWDMEQREHHIPEALAVARELARDYPENAQLTAFIAAHR
jgi:hypothetical protein